MRFPLTCGLAALIGLTACAEVSTGVRSPCFERGNAAVTRGFSFAAVPVGSAAETATPTSNPGGANGCNFRDF